MRIYLFDISHLMQVELHDEKARREAWDVAFRNRSENSSGDTPFGV
jgi:hypothetical protein